jgi:HD superfamily phosphohydrolase YqeK
MLLLVSDKLARAFDGSMEPAAYLIVRISKCLVYCLFLLIIFSFAQYLKDLFQNEGKTEKVPKSLGVSEIVVLVGITVLLVSQFTGLYYSYDENNVYHRAPLNALSYFFPLVAVSTQAVTIVLYRKKLRKKLLFPLLLFTIMPILASVPQFLFHGISFTSTSIVAMVILLYCFSIIDTNKLVKTAHENEVNALKKEQRNVKLMISQTVEALAEAIDAKDRYTNGHSRRVALYSKMIAEKAGKDKETCDEIYIIGLLHDVGKIGIPNAIINKETRLTDEEYEIVKTHTIAGKRILSKISISPDLVLGANYHHERFDGKGYPEGLVGENIPEIARIIAVADAYDAMASKRSYRDALPQEKIRNEFVKGAGTQFDPTFAKIMIELINADTDYQMRET